MTDLEALTAIARIQVEAKQFFAELEKTANELLADIDREADYDDKAQMS